ncbi:MAG: PAS domain S-box-containing protein [Gammaproteobacteria bacterium]|jgi:PAS domain S-box-containing protein
MKQQHGFRHINENKTKDGRILTCEWYNTPLVDAAGKTIGVVALGEDITVRKQPEELI